MNLARQIIFIILGTLQFCSLLEAKTLRMGGNFYNPPYLYIEEGNIYSGFEVDLIREIGELKGFNIEFHSKIFPQIFEDLENKEIDFIGNVFYSKKREESYLLSTPHYLDYIEFLTLKDKKITNPLEGDFTVSTLGYSPVEEIFQQQVMVDHPNLKMQSDLTTYMGFKNLFVKKSDLLLTTRSSINQLRRNYPKYAGQFQVFAFPNTYPQNVAMSFLTTKDNTQLIQDINDGLKTLKENGTYQKLIEKYGL